MEQPIISGVTHDISEAKITIFAGARPARASRRRLFRALADEDVNVDMIVQNVSTDGHTDISFTVPRDELTAHDGRSWRRSSSRSRPAAPTTTPASAGSRSSARA